MSRDFQWTCRRSGDCCLEVRVISLTPAERDVLAQARPDVALDVVPQKDTRFLTWSVPKGCPFLSRGLDGLATCTVHEIRPYNCRRFLCLRDEGEPYRSGGPMGCKNLSERIDRNVHAMEFYRTHQRYAQRDWADSHGWSR